MAFNTYTDGFPLHFRNLLLEYQKKYHPGGCVDIILSGNMEKIKFVCRESLEGKIFGIGMVNLYKEKAKINKKSSKEFREYVEQKLEKIKSKNNWRKEEQLEIEIKSAKVNLEKIYRSAVDASKIFIKKTQYNKETIDCVYLAYVSESIKEIICEYNKFFPVKKRSLEDRKKIVELEEISEKIDELVM